MAEVSPISPSSYTEKHLLNGSEQSAIRFHMGRNVILNVEQQSECARDSARTNSKILCEYKLGSKSHYEGQILSCRSNFVAYRIFSETTGEAVRILERETRARHLIKEFRKPIVDVQWANHAPFLAILDQSCNLYVYSLNESDNNISKYVNIMQACSQNVDESTDPSKYGNMKICWCPYVPLPEEDPADNKLILAVSNINSIHIFLIDKIMSKIGMGEILFEHAKLAGGILSLDLDSNITSLKLSPDASALAVSTMDGFFSSYIIDATEIRFANKVRPLPNSHIEEFTFLDNLTVHDSDPFWINVLVSADSGRRLAIFDYDSWECLAKLRFMSDQSHRLQLLTESTSQFVFVFDYETSNLFCVELGYALSKPRFASCTLVKFSKLYISVASPILIESRDNEEELGDFYDGSMASSNSIMALFTAITRRSVIEFTVELEPVFTDSLSCAERNLLCVANHSNVSSDVFSTRADSSNTRQLNQEDNASVKDKPAKTNGVIENFTQFFEHKFDEMDRKLNDLNDKISKLQNENDQLKTQQEEGFSNMATYLSQNCDLIRQNVNQSLQNSNSELVSQLSKSIETPMVAQFSQLQNTIESFSQSVQTTNSNTNQVLISEIETICAHLFSNLNEKFSVGLTEFLHQLKAIQQLATPAAATSFISAPTDQQVILQLLDTKQFGQAFEIALSHFDPLALMFVCSRVNPDHLFANGNPLNPSSLLAILQILSQRLDLNTDLRLRYIQNILLIIFDASRNKHDEALKATLEHVLKTLRVFGASDINFKLQLRTIEQLIKAILNLLA